MDTQGGSCKVSGFVTQVKYLRNQSLREIERRLGFQSGRLAKGATFVILDRLPMVGEFETAGYSQVAGHRHVFPGGLDRDKIEELARAAWSATGENRLIKVRPITSHDSSIPNDEQYPPGSGIPQWKLTKQINGRVVASMTGYGQVLTLTNV